MYKVLIEHELQKEVALEYRVSPIVVSCLICKVKKNKKYLQEIADKIADIKDRRSRISMIIKKLN